MSFFSTVSQENLFVFVFPQSFVHVSTAYANCTQNPIEEKFYDPPIEADKLMMMVECVDDHLASVITPQ